MNSKLFFDWCRTAVGGIRYRPDRDRVHKELYQHMEDRYESFIERGAEPAEAQKSTILAMGDAEEVALQLAAVYRPFWSYALLISRCMVLLLGVLTAFSLIRWVFVVDITKGDFQEFYPQLNYDAYMDTGYSAGGEFGSRVLYLEPGCSVSIDGYEITVKKAALWHIQYGETNEHLMHIQLEVINLKPWSDPLQITKLFYAKDDLGNEYVNMHAAGDNAVPVFGGDYRRTGLVKYKYEIYLDHFVSCDARWIDLCYEREDRKLNLRIALTGGAEQ